MIGVRLCPDTNLSGKVVTARHRRLTPTATATLFLSLLVPIRASSQSTIQSQSLPSSTSAASISIYGRVINTATGLPIPRALVRLNQRAVLTDHEGKFQFDQVTDTNANLQAVKPGFSMSMDPTDPGGQSVQVAQITGSVELRLYPEALLTGTVTSPDGAPLAQVFVSARRLTFDDSGHHWSTAGQAQSDRHGEFRIPVPAGDYRLETRYIPRSNGSPDAILPIALPAPAAGGDLRADQSIHLRPGQELHFDLQPAVRRTYPVTIAIESHGERGVPSITARTSDGVSFNVPAGGNRGPGFQNQNSNQVTINLPTGTYTLSARVQNRESNESAETRITVTGTNTETSNAVLRFVPTPSIPVELSIDPNATSDNIQSSTSSNAAPNSSSQTSGNTPNSPTLQQFSLSLQRLDPTSDDDPSTIGFSAPRSGPSVFSAPPGTYRLSARNSGHWYIRSASYGASDLTRQSFTVSAGSSSATIRLIVTNLTGSLQGTVLLNGVPSSSWIYLIPDTPALPSLISARSGSAGNVSSAYLPPGTYRVIAFERRHSVDFTDPEVLTPYASYIQSVTITSGNASTLNLIAVPQLDVDSRVHP